MLILSRPIGSRACCCKCSTAVRVLDRIGAGSAGLLRPPRLHQATAAPTSVKILREEGLRWGTRPWSRKE